jgi:hypothetical protein
MSKLTEALKRKYKTPEAAVEALGLDASLLKSAVVGDSKLNQKELNMSTKRILTRKAATAQGALMTWLKPKMAKDAKPLDWGKILGSVTHKNFASKKGAIVAGIKEQTKGRLAKDASVDGLVELLDGLEKVESLEHGDADALETDPNSGMPMKAEMSEEDEDETMDEDPGEKLKGYLSSKGMSEDDIAGAVDAAGFGPKAEEGEDQENEPEGVPKSKLGSEKAAEEGEDEVDEEDGAKFAKAKDKKAKDEPPPFKGKPEVGGKMSGDQVHAAIARAVKVANDSADKKIADMREATKATRDAERFVRPWVGDLAMAHDSAEGVYKTALTALGVDTKGVHPSAFKVILERIPQPGKQRQQAQDDSLGMDSSSVSDFNKRYPDAAKIGFA